MVDLESIAKRAQERAQEKEYNAQVARYNRSSSGYFIIGKPFNGSTRLYNNNESLTDIIKQGRKADEYRKPIQRAPRESFVMKYLFG